MMPYAMARPMKENFCQWGSSSILRHQGGRSSGWMPNVCRGSQPASQCASLIAGAPGLHQAAGRWLEQAEGMQGILQGALAGGQQSDC